MNKAASWYTTYDVNGNKIPGCNGYNIGSLTNGVTYNFFVYVSSGTTWKYMRGLTNIGQCTLGSSVATNSNFNPQAVAEITAAPDGPGFPKDVGNILGPSDFGYPALEYIGYSDGLWHDFPDGTATYAALNPYGDQSHVCTPYGVVGLAFNKMKAGHNVACTTEGTTIW
jgi:hypothetical protein